MITLRTVLNVLHAFLNTKLQLLLESAGEEATRQPDQRLRRPPDLEGEGTDNVFESIHEDVAAGDGNGDGAGDAGDDSADDCGDTGFYS